MPIDVDGASILATIAREPQLFAVVRDQASVIARNLVSKQLKDKSTHYDVLRMIAQSIGHRDFAVILDNMSDAEIKSVLKRVDGSNVSPMTDAAQWRRARLLALGTGLETPGVRTEASVAILAKPSKGSPKIRRAISSRAMRARKLAPPRTE